MSSVVASSPAWPATRKLASQASKLNAQGESELASARPTNEPKLIIITTRRQRFAIWFAKKKLAKGPTKFFFLPFIQRAKVEEQATEITAPAKHRVAAF